MQQDCFINRYSLILLRKDYQGFREVSIELM